MQIISIPVVQGFICKETSSIIRIEASSNYSRIYCSDERYPIIVAKILSWFQNNLPQKDFIRAHRTHLVNKRFIEKKISNELLLHNGETIRISKRRMHEMKEMI